MRYESIIVKRSIWVCKNTIVAGCLDKATLIFLNAALPFAGHLYLNTVHYSVFEIIFHVYLSHSASIMWKVLKPLVLVLSMARFSSCPLLWASRSRCSVSQTGTGVAVIQPRAQRWAHRQPYYHHRTLLISSEGGEFSTEAGLNLPALVRVAPIDYRLGQRPQQS